MPARPGLSRRLKALCRLETRARRCSRPLPPHPRGARATPPVQAAWELLQLELAATSEDRDQLLADSAALAADLSSCATNLQVGLTEQTGAA